MSSAFCFVLLIGGVLALPSAARACATLPTNIQADARFEPVVEDLLDASPTFAGQCARLAGDAFVAIRALPRGEESCCRARASIRRYDSGLLIAVIELPALRTRSEYAELLGHEFEHIVEQLDGVDLDVRGYRLVQATGGVAESFETARARTAGLTVLSEAFRAGW